MVKYSSLGEYQRGVSGSIKRGARGLYAGTNGALFGALKRRETILKETAEFMTAGVIYVRVMEVEDDLSARLGQIFGPARKYEGRKKKKKRGAGLSCARETKQMEAQLLAGLWPSWSVSQIGRAHV